MSAVVGRISRVTEIVQSPTHPEPIAEPEPIVIVEHRLSLWQSVRETWEYRSTLPDLGRSMLKMQWQRTVLGFWWIPILVFFATVGRTLIFGRILGVPSAKGIPYFLFLVVGTFAWTV